MADNTLIPKNSCTILLRIPIMKSIFKYGSSALLICLGLILCPNPASAQSFGQNKVQYNPLDWKFIQTPHFDIYYTEGGLEIAKFAAKESEKAYRYIAEDFRWVLPESDRISIITYESHNDFEQTNIKTSPVSEGEKGFTEFMKNRIALPYEGSWEDFRHTIHHELTHAITLYMFYGSGMMSIIQGISRTSVPLWFIEGLAEYESRFGMDTESEMYIRDLVVNSRLPDIEALDYYGYVGVYKCGQSVMDFIAETYGKEKIGELLHQIKTSHDAGRAIKKSLGLDWKELNRRWRKYINKYHWPVGAVTEQPVDFAEKITDHKEQEYNYYDISPAVSPRGDMLVYISNQSDYFDVYLYSLIENKRIKKLLSGERDKAFEELHIIRPGISWSPDSKSIVLASKAGGRDALSIVDVNRAKVTRSISFQMDGIFSPAWSPMGDEIAFVGVDDGQSDIYIINLDNGELSKVTDDVFSDLSPSWSPDGEYLTFTSDRRDYLDMDYLPLDFDIFEFDYNNFDVYIGSKSEGWKLSRITYSPDWDRNPIFAGNDALIYVSDQNGIYNLFHLNLETKESYPLTNVVTGILQPSISQKGDKLAFVSLYNFGYDIYLMTDPLDEQNKKTLKLTPLKEKLAAGSPHPVPELYQDDYNLPEDINESRPFKNFVFDFRKRNYTKEETEELPDTTTFVTEAGDYIENDYKIRFTADYVYANAYFSSIWGARGVAVAQFSDVLGDQNITLMTDLQNRIEVSNYLVGYQYLPHRVDFGLSLYHFMYYFYTSGYTTGYSYFYDRTLFRDRNYGISASASYPISKFKRLELNTDLVAVDRSVWSDYFEEFDNFLQRRMLVTQLAYVKDNSIGRYFGPMNGNRLRLSATASPDLYPDNGKYDSRQGVDYYTLNGDFRQYLRAGFDYSFALRLSAGASFGKNPARFFLGGVSNWINRPYYIDIQESDIEDLYVAQFITPLRGGSLYEKIGDRYFLFNSEFRFPFIQYLIFGWPIPYPFINVRGALFYDIGAAWYGDLEKFNLFHKDADGKKKLDDASMGLGFGIRFPFPFIGWPTKWDVAWETDMADISKPRYYLSLGYEF